MDIKEEQLDQMDECLIDISFGNVSENLVVDPLEYVGIKLENEEWHSELQSVPLIKHEAEVETLTNFDCDEIEIEEHFIKKEEDKSDIHEVPSVEEKADFYSLFFSTYEEDLIEDEDSKNEILSEPSKGALIEKDASINIPTLFGGDETKIEEYLRKIEEENNIVSFNTWQEGVEKTKSLLEIETDQNYIDSFDTQKKLIEIRKRYRQIILKGAEINKKCIQEKTNVCKQCNKSYKVYMEKKSLIEYKCKQCESKFNKKLDLERHRHIHTAEKLFKWENLNLCKLWDNKLKDKDYVEKNCLIYTVENEYKCKHCKAKFNNKQDLEKHRRIHTTEKPFKCELCDDKFDQEVDLQRHKQIHTTEKPYECEECGDKFYTIIRFNRHKLIHTGRKKIYCLLCKAEFNKIIDLKNHKTIHIKEELFTCEECNAEFLSKEALKKHIIGSRKLKFECVLCHIKFHSRCSLKQHIIKHRPTKCTNAL